MVLICYVSIHLLATSRVTVHDADRSSIVCLIITLWITDLARSEFTSFRSMLLFSALYTPYLILNATMGVYAHAREIIGYSSWNPTSRK